MTMLSELRSLLFQLKAKENEKITKTKQNKKTQSPSRRGAKPKGPIIQTFPPPVNENGIRNHNLNR